MSAVRGYATWDPKPEAMHWVRCTARVLEQYRDYWPLTVRQLFYRLVAAYEYEKTENAYSKLTQMISRARRAGLLPWPAVRDGGQGKSLGAHYYSDAQHFEDSVKASARAFKLDRQRDQEAVIELWCEAGGMVPILQGIAAPYSARVNSGGGYDSVTSKHRLALRVRDRAEEGLRTLIIHVGDFDGSGEDMCNVLREDTLHMAITQVLGGVAAGEVPEPEGVQLHEDADHYTSAAVRWAADFFDVKRVALTPEQVVEREVITAPPKRSDSRTEEFVRRNAWVVDELGTEDISAQLEALTPPELEELISGAIEAELDLEVYGAVLEEEEGIRQDVIKRLER